jgi:hypothetical protein
MIGRTGTLAVFRNDLREAFDGLYRLMSCGSLGLDDILDSDVVDKLTHELATAINATEDALALFLEAVAPDERESR